MARRSRRTEDIKRVVLLDGTWSASLLWEIPLTYATPFIVARLGALDHRRTSDETGDQTQAK